MKEVSYNSTNFAMRYLDVIPTSVFVVDDDVRLLDFNLSSQVSFDLQADSVLLKSGGDALHCIHSFDHPEGCGRGPACGDCVLRNSVKYAVDNQRIYRKHHEMVLLKDDTERRIDAYVTTAPIIYEEQARVMLAIEDISELFELRKLIPICAWCKKVRNDGNYWESVDAYLSKTLKFDLTHGVCPDCSIKIKQEIAELDLRTKPDHLH